MLAWMPAAAVGALLAGLVWSARRPASWAVAVDDAHVVIHFTGLDRIWAMRGRIGIERAAVVSVDAVPVALVAQRLRLRMAGTSIPGLQAGRFNGDGDEFWLVHGERDAVQITLEGEGFQRIVLGSPDAEEVARDLRGELFAPRT